MHQLGGPGHGGRGAPRWLALPSGTPLWRAPGEQAADDGRAARSGDEFVASMMDGLDAVDRRDFLRVMAASLAMASLAGCERPPAVPIVPYAHAEPGVTPGRPQFFATAITRAGYARGVLVESHTGRPTKIEGNPDHPSSLGATDIFTQAAVLGLYDPDRSQVVREGGRISTWERFEEALRARLALLRPRAGRGLRLLTGAVTSPTLTAQIQSILRELPEAQWHLHEPVGAANARAGARLAAGRPLDPVYRFDNARVVVALDSDFLFDLPGSVRYTRDFAAGRTTGPVSRLYVAEPGPTITGARADHRLPVRRSGIAALALSIARALGVTAGDGPRATDSGPEARWAADAAADLSAARGASVLIAGEAQPPEVHALVMAVNAALGNLGRTVVTIEPVEGSATALPLEDLAADMAAGAVTDLLVIGANPVYDAPRTLDLAARLGQVGFTAHLGLYHDETARRCAWHLAAAHDLESWSDARAHDGTAGIIQPLIAPLYQGRTPHEVLAMLQDSAAGATGYEIVREHWRQGQAAGDFERWWWTALRAGVIPGTQSPEAATTISPAAIEQAAAALTPGAAAAPGLELFMSPDPTVWDGRFANNAWLQELPKPITRVTWDNPALVSPRTAERIGLKTGDVVSVSARGQEIEAAVLVNPGQADDCIGLTIGYGRTACGRTGDGTGFDVYPLRAPGSLWCAVNAGVRRTGRTSALALTQRHHAMEGRDLVRTVTPPPVDRPQPAGSGPEDRAVHLSLYPAVKREGQQWGMSIDLAACTGCQACVIACQAENNIPVVGKEQVRREREMHWIRVDRYYSGSLADPAILRQPVPCMQCENAPCELVCPVGATQHSADGLNDMVYNRCIGTRYCSNNCPYKVRRFNFLQYTDNTTESLRLQRNPEVTVRARGVMEKCTYCVQRIRAADIHARRENRTIRDGEVVTACQQACPAGAIIFGDVADPLARVSVAKRDPRDYALLADLNTRPRTTYLADIRNPGPTRAAAGRGAP
ncbi:MAG: 4Fe-4S dicluster domain-containing protein [Phycisphaerales bacterium]|nr:4Fe-4S dicluster domain-containing protein [Phycisphaerales bacterium]